MPKKLDEELERHRKHEQDKAREWHGKANYTSPRMAESWDRPDIPLSFEQRPVDGAMKVLSVYRNELRKEHGELSAEELFAERKRSQRSTYARWQDPRESRLTPFDEAFRIDPDDRSQYGRKKPSWFRRLFGRRSR